MADGGYGPIMQADGAVQVIAEQVMGTLFWLVFVFLFLIFIQINCIILCLYQYLKCLFLMMTNLFYFPISFLLKASFTICLDQNIIITYTLCYQNVPKVVRLILYYSSHVYYFYREYMNKITNVSLSSEKSMPNTSIINHFIIKYRTHGMITKRFWGCVAWSYHCILSLTLIIYLKVIHIAVYLDLLCRLLM